MVIRGKSRGNGKQLGAYLLAQRDNDEKPQVLEMRGFADADPLAALINAGLDVATVSRSQKPFYHGILNPRENEAATMDREQWIFAADIMEKALKYEGLPRLIVPHVKDGRYHAHIVWLRYDHNTARLRPDTYNFYKHNAARATIEQALGHERTPARRDRTKEPSHKERLTQLWRDSASAADFVSQAQAAGYEIGQGLDRHPYRAITPEGKSLDLVRQLDGYRKSDVQARFKGYDLPTEAHALKDGQARSQTRQQVTEPAAAGDLFAQLAERDRRAELMRDFADNIDAPANDNQPDVFEQLVQQQSQPRKRNRGLEY